MKRDILKGHTDTMLIKQAIVNNFSNADIVLKSEEQVELEALIAKGEIETITPEQIAKDYAGKFYTPQAIAKFNEQLDGMIQKGESNFLEQGEWDYIEKGQSDVKALQVKALVINNNGFQIMRKIYVTAKTDDLIKSEGIADLGKLDTSIEKAEGKYGKGKHKQAVTVNRGGKSFVQQRTVGTKDDDSKWDVIRSSNKSTWHTQVKKVIGEKAYKKYILDHPGINKEETGHSFLSNIASDLKKKYGVPTDIGKYVASVAGHHEEKAKKSPAKKDDWDEPVRDPKKYAEHKASEQAKTKTGGKLTAEQHLEKHKFHSKESSRLSKLAKNDKEGPNGMQK